MSAVQEYVDAVTTLREVQQRVDESESRMRASDARAQDTEPLVQQLRDAVERSRRILGPRSAFGRELRGAVLAPSRPGSGAVSPHRSIETLEGGHMANAFFSSWNAMRRGSAQASALSSLSIA
jgi:hypothetical protein